MHSERRAQASKLLSAVAKKVQNPRLATLAVRVRLDAFTRVKKAIDDMVAQLLKEKEDEIKHKDFCVKVNKVVSEAQKERMIKEGVKNKAKLHLLSKRRGVLSSRTGILSLLQAAAGRVDLVSSSRSTSGLAQWEC